MTIVPDNLDNVFPRLTCFHVNNIPSRPSSLKMLQLSRHYKNVFRSMRSGMPVSLLAALSFELFMAASLTHFPSSSCLIVKNTIPSLDFAIAFESATSLSRVHLRPPGFSPSRCAANFSLLRAWISCEGPWPVVTIKTVFLCALRKISRRPASRRCSFSVLGGLALCTRWDTIKFIFPPLHALAVRAKTCWSESHAIACTLLGPANLWSGFGRAMSAHVRLCASTMLNSAHVVGFSIPKRGPFLILS
mmetsp:Transcript_35440/g.68857  ORF Transcript_35440/g.68857 Transcript_35440/m.68857 type:complete len:247 (+) Transcript_35440:37-777(+)